MPELPDLALYVDAIASRTVGQTLEQIRIVGVNLLRTVTPEPEATAGRRVRGVRRMAKRIVIELEGGIYLVLHLMIAGRLHWREPRAKVPAKVGLAAFDFAGGSLVLTEAGSSKRASLHLVGDEAALAALDPGGVEPLEATLEQFGDALRRENHTVKRALTDPRLFAGIGNAYSDEILHRAKLSPLVLTSRLRPAEVARLFEAMRETLSLWTARLREEAGEGFPEKVTAFRPGMAVHGRYRHPCPVCGAPVQRVVYADNETNYCARCQTGGRLLADRALSRLLKADWPRTLEELEE